MKKLLTKLSAFVVAVALILSSMTTVFAKSISDYFTVTGEIKLGETKTVTIEDAVNDNGHENYVYYKFVPGETDVYTLAFDQDDDDFDIGFELLDANFSMLNNRTTYFTDISSQVFYAKQGKTYYFALYISNEKDNSTFDIKLDKLVSNTANVLKLGESKTVNVQTSGESVFYKFTPAEAGFYEIVSETADDDCDPYATLYDSKFNEINNDDDSLGGYNFSLKLNAVAGKTYYVEFSAYNDNSTYKVNVNKFSTDGFTEIKSGDNKTFDIKKEKETVYYTFTPTESGIYKLSSDSGDNSRIIDPGVLLYDSNFEFLVDCDDADESREFQLEFTAVAGETYYIGVYGREVGTKFNFTLEQIKFDEIKSGDTKSVNAETAYEKIYYKFTPTTSGNYILTSDMGENDVDPRVKLYDKTLKLIDNNDDANNTYDFELAFNAIAGETYYIAVYDNHYDAQFDFTLKSLTVGELKLGENQNVNIKRSKDTSYYKFTPAETGCYVVTSDCGDDVNDIDPCVYLFDENFEQLGYNHDRDEDYEFELAYELEAGKTYYYAVNASYDDVQFKFSIQKHYCITHQPTSGEPYVDFGWNAAKDYQWYTVSLPETEITDKNSTPAETEVSISTYSQTDGWTTDSSTYYWYLFTLDLKEGEKISFETDGYFYEASIGITTDSESDYVYYDGNSFYELTAPKTGTYVFAISQPETNLKVKVYKGGLTYNKIDGQNTNTLTKYTLGEYYACKLTANGETYTSNSFECKYAIVHQPTEKELYVKPNIEDGAKYQWYYAESAEVELTDKNTEAVVDMYYTEPATYDATTGWSGHRWAYLENNDGDYYVNSDDGAIFFKVKLKKGDTVKFVFDGEVEAIALASTELNYNETKYIDDEDTVTITAPADGEYYVTAECDYETTLKAYKTTGYKYTKIDGETSQDLKNAEGGKTYACEVTFADGTTEMSDVVTIPKAENGTSTESKVDTSDKSPATADSCQTAVLLLLAAICPFTLAFKTKKKA